MESPASADRSELLQSSLLRQIRAIDHAFETRGSRLESQLPAPVARVRQIHERGVILIDTDAATGFWHHTTRRLATPGRRAMHLSPPAPRHPSLSPRPTACPYCFPSTTAARWRRRTLAGVASQRESCGRPWRACATSVVPTPRASWQLLAREPAPAAIASARKYARASWRQACPRPSSAPSCCSPSPMDCRRSWLILPVDPRRPIVCILPILSRGPGSRRDRVTFAISAPRPTTSW